MMLMIVVVVVVVKRATDSTPFALRISEEEDEGERGGEVELDARGMINNYHDELLYSRIQTYTHAHREE